MSDDLNAITGFRISELVVEALERTAFVLADVADEDEIDGRFEPDRFARIEFTGVATGMILLSADTNFLVELASSMLGCAPEEVDLNEQGRDALNELANIVGGSIIIDLGGKDHEYSYGLPEAVERENVPSTSTGTAGWVESEDGLLQVTWLPSSALNQAA